ncbi:MAG: putative cytosolic protein [Deltaproteobacteria bacterium]|nr:putative cytosolic protein [Deltaproteobacteria bacterium]
MIRAKLWFRCAAMHDPVTPMVVQPALVGWEAKKRRVDLTIERAFNGEELVKRMKGWVTTDPKEVIEVVKQYGRLKVLDDRELVVEIDEAENFDKLQDVLKEAFHGEVDVELVKKRG